MLGVENVDASAPTAPRVAAEEKFECILCTGESGIVSWKCWSLKFGNQRTARIARNSVGFFTRGALKIPSSTRYHLTCRCLLTYLIYFGVLLAAEATILTSQPFFVTMACHCVWNFLGARYLNRGTRWCCRIFGHAFIWARLAIVTATAQSACLTLASARTDEKRSRDSR